MLGEYDMAQRLDETRAAYADALPVAQGAKRVVEVLLGMPLATQTRLAAALRLSAADLHPPMTELREKGLVDSVTLGGSAQGSKPTPRWFFTEQAIELFGNLPVTWHQEGNRGSLLDRLPVLDWCYRAATDIDYYGEFREFLWLDEGGLDAFARYEHAWVGLMWSGMLESAADLDARFRRLAGDVFSLAIGPEFRPWPGTLAVVVPDRWQLQLVMQAAHRYGLTRHIGTWCIADGSRTRPANEGASRGWIHQQVVPRETGDWSWEARVAGSIWSQPLAPSVYRTFRTVAEYPGITRPVLQRMLGEGPKGSLTKRSVRTLLRLDLVETLSERDLTGGDDSAKDRKRWLRLTEKGIDRLARMERGTYKAYRTRAMGQSWLSKPARKAHEEGVFALLADFRWEEGLDAAPGWRYYDAMGRRGAVVPDGMMWVNRSVFGPGWLLLEYERSARSPSQVVRKTQNHSREARRMDLPLAVVCWNDTAEGNFHAEGQRSNTKMLTTTIPRLGEHPPLNNFDCWLYYGERVRLS